MEDLKTFTLGVIVGILMLATLAPFFIEGERHNNLTIYEDQTWSYKENK